METNEFGGRPTPTEEEIPVGRPKNKIAPRHAVLFKH